jgi:quercetin dioxygenase-like cupin family protein
VTEPDPAATNPGLYTVVFENDEVRVLEYRDKPGDRTTPHAHPDSVMYALSAFRRRLRSEGLERDVELAAGQVSWLPAQEHSGENIGVTDTHLLFVELKVASHQRLPPEHGLLPEVELGPNGV